MFSRLVNWIKSLFSSVQAEENYALYKPSERLIYSFFNGEKEVHADPMVLVRRLADVGTDLAHDLITMGVPGLKGVEQSYEGALKKIRKIFDVKKYEEGGLTEPETFALFDHFYRYTEHIKKNSRAIATSQEETSPTTPPSAEQNPVTTSTSDTGSTGNAPSTEQQTQSTSEQASHSESHPHKTSGEQSQTENAKQSLSNPSSTPETDNKEVA